MLKYRVMFFREGKYYNFPLKTELLSRNEMESYDAAGANYLRISDLADTTIINERKKGNSILIKKNIDDKEINVNDLIIIENDEKILEKLDENPEDIPDEELDEHYEILFEKYKTSLINQAFIDFVPTMNITKVYDIYNYVELWSELFVKGFVVTEDNKEDIFIEIIEKDDDDLLKTLELFLDTRESFADFKKSKERYSFIKNELEDIYYFEFDNYKEAKEALDSKYKELKDKFN